MAVEWGSAFNQQRAQVVGMFVLIEDNDERTFRRNRNKVGIRHGVAFAAGHANRVWLERHGAVEFANGLNDHGKRIAVVVEFRKLRLKWLAQCPSATQIGSAMSCFARQILLLT